MSKVKVKKGSIQGKRQGKGLARGPTQSPEPREACRLSRVHGMDVPVPVEVFQIVRGSVVDLAREALGLIPGLMSNHER